MKTLAERFEQYVHPEPNSGCHLWSGGVSVSGGKGNARLREEAKTYGSFRLGSRKDGTYRVQRAHRVAWELANNAEVPKGMSVLHRCDAPLCVNPDHLSLGTCADNGRDMARKGRGVSDRGRFPFGVSRVYNKYRAQIRDSGRDVYLGLFSTIEEAAEVARNAKAAI